MKNKFKFLIASISISMLFLSSCEKEMYDDAIYQSQQPQNLSISKINFKELKSNKNAVEKIKHVMSKKLPTSIANRAVYNEDFGVLIDTTNIVQMTSSTKQTITLNIVNYDVTSKKENLILVSNNNGDFEAFIAEYNLNQNDLDILANGGTLYNIQPTNISEIENTSKIAVSGSCASSYTYSYWACYNANGNIMANNGELNNGCVGLGFPVEMQVITIDMSCLSGGGGGGTSGISGTSGTNGTGTSGTGTTGSGPTGGSTSTGSNNPNSNQSILDLLNTTFVPCNSCIEFSQTLSNFLQGLTPEQLEYWNDLSPKEQKTIVDYLEANNSSINSINQMLQLINSNIIVKKITDTNLDPCGKSVLTKLKNLRQNDIASILRRFGDVNSIFNLNFSTAYPNDPNALASTNWVLDSNSNTIAYNYLIKIRPEETQISTELAIAGSLLHEIIHAYFLSLIDDCIQANNCTTLQTFPELWNYYVANQTGNPTNGISQHNQIALSYVNIMGAALQEYITGIPVQPGSQSQVYTDVAWYGLQGTIPYNALPQSEKDRINFRFENVELLNQSSVNPNGVTINPVGTRNTPC